MQQQTVGLIGFPLAQSFSNKYFTAKFQQLGLTNFQHVVCPMQSVADGLPAMLKTYPDLLGFNVTIPHKENILPFLDEQNEVVQKMAACNCVRVKDGKLKGYNTDVIGFKQSLLPLLQSCHSKALVLGTGGASKAVQYVLEELGIGYLLVSRKKQGESTITYSELTEDIVQNHRLIVNTTPVGMYPKVDACPDLPYMFMGEKHLCYDLIYNPDETLFLKKSREAGAVIKNGYEMLIIQAEESWRIWND